MAHFHLDWLALAAGLFGSLSAEFKVAFLALGFDPWGEGFGGVEVALEVAEDLS